jgi:hypothetical protein
VPSAHNKDPKAHGKAFVVCRPQQSAHDKYRPTKSMFVMCFLLGTQQTFVVRLGVLLGKRKSSDGL